VQEVLFPIARSIGHTTYAILMSVSMELPPRFGAKQSSHPPLDLIHTSVAPESKLSTYIIRSKLMAIP
jgi:hypothetical protein